jgi:hypothetical protein
MGWDVSVMVGLAPLQWVCGKSLFWQREDVRDAAAHLMVARKQKNTERRRPFTDYILQRHVLQQPTAPIRPHLTQRPESTSR